MKTLTATNKRVQFFLTYATEKPATALKQQRLKQLEATLGERNIMIDELFPSKQLQVLDYLLYISSGSGIAKVGAEKIAEKCECSVRTVYNAIKAIKQTNEFIVARLIKSKGGAGKYVLVDKKHINFKEIMREVFMLSNNKIAEQFAGLFAEQDISQSVGTHSVEGNKSTSNITNSFNSKQAIDIYISESIKDEIETTNDNSRAYLVEHASNTYQIALFDFISVLPVPKQIESVKGILALRMGSDATTKTFMKAKDLIIEMAKRVSEGVRYENVVAAFTSGLAKAMQYDVPKSINQPKTPAPKVEFYNWLEIRE